jgi:hypothetical protein
MQPAMVFFMLPFADDIPLQDFKAFHQLSLQFDRKLPVGYWEQQVILLTDVAPGKMIMALLRFVLPGIPQPQADHHRHQPDRDAHDLCPIDPRV